MPTDICREMPALTPEMIAEYHARTVTVPRSDLRAALLALESGRPDEARAILARLMEHES